MTLLEAIEEFQKREAEELCAQTEKKRIEKMILNTPSVDKATAINREIRVGDKILYVAYGGLSVRNLDEINANEKVDESCLVSPW